MTCRNSVISHERITIQRSCSFRIGRHKKPLSYPETYGKNVAMLADLAQLNRRLFRSALDAKIRVSGSVLGRLTSWHNDQVAETLANSGYILLVPSSFDYSKPPSHQLPEPHIREYVLTLRLAALMDYPRAIDAFGLTRDVATQVIETPAAVPVGNWQFRFPENILDVAVKQPSDVALRGYLTLVKT